MVNKYFRLKEKGSNVRIEVMAGLTTFLTMAYIIFVNPDILSVTGMDKTALIAVTCIVTAISTLIVGLFMAKEVKRIDFMNLQEGFPAFIIIVMIALSYSISTGLAFGFIAFILMKTVSSKAKEIKPVMWIVTVLSILFLILD